MNSEQFVAGQLFNYHGHFHNLRTKPYQYDNATRNLMDRSGEVFGSVSIPELDFFYLHTKQYGRIKVFFNECRPVNND